MLLTYLDPAKIKTKSWFMVELSSERTSEETLKRVGKTLPSVFKDDPVELFIPVRSRDLEVFELMTGPYVFIHTDDPMKIGKLRRITGVVGVLAKDESASPSKFLPVEDSYVRNLIAECRDYHFRQVMQIKKGAWVRILDGYTRDYCGTVVAIRAGMAVVSVDLKTKLMMVETPVANLLNLTLVPDAHRVFYYAEAVKTFLEEEPDGTVLLEQDLAYDETLVKLTLEDEEGMNENGCDVGGTPHQSREATPTRFLRARILAGQHDPQALLAELAEAINGNKLRKPKTLMILWHVFRDSILEHMFADDPTIKSYSDIVAAKGAAFKINLKDVAAVIHDIPLRPTERHPVSVSAFAKTRLMAGVSDAKVLVQDVDEALTAGKIKPPKNLMSLIQALRISAIRVHKRKDYRDLVAAHPDLEISAKEVQASNPGLVGKLNTDPPALRAI